MKTKKLIAFLLVLCLTLGSAVSVFAATSQGTAANITLVKFSGTVTVTNASEKNVSARTGMRLYSGYTITTGAESNAYISLDSSKALLLESSSKLILRKSGNKIDVMLETGTVVCDVSESLTKNQTLDIHTTNMVTGIRGTGVEVSYFSRLAATRICMLHGSTKNFNKFNIGHVQVVDAGHGIEIGGGAAVVQTMGDAIAVSDLQPQTQQLMVVDGGISEEVLEGFNETFGLDDMSSEDAADLQTAVKAAVEAQIQEQLAADEAAGQAAEDALTEDNTGGTEGSVSEEEQTQGYVDPVFEDQKEATGAGATMTEPNDATTALADSGSSGGSSSSSSSSGSSGDSGSQTATLSSDPVNFTVPGGDSFSSVFVYKDGEQHYVEDPNGETFKATPSSIVFVLCYEEGGASSGFTVTNVTASLGSTALSPTSTPSGFTGSGKYFAKDEFPDGATLNASITMKLEKLSEDPNANDNVLRNLSGLMSSKLFTSGTINYDSRDAEALDSYINGGKFTFVAYQGTNSGSTGGISITVPDGGNYSVAVYEGSSTTPLTATSTDDNGASVYTTSADTIRFTLTPPTSSGNYYGAASIGQSPSIKVSFSGAENTDPNDDSYSVVATNPGSDFTMRYALDLMTAPELDSSSSTFNGSEFVADLSPAVESLFNSDLFVDPKLYYHNDEDTLAYLPEVVNMSDSRVVSYNLVLFLVDDESEPSWYYAYDGVLPSAPDPDEPQSYTYTPTSGGESQQLPFAGWYVIGLDTNNKPVCNPYQYSSETMTEDLYVYAGYTLDDGVYFPVIDMSF